MKSIELTHVDIKTETRAVPAGSRFYTVAEYKGLNNFINDWGKEPQSRSAHVDTEEYEIVEFAEGKRRFYIGVSTKQKELLKNLMGYTEQQVNTALEENRQLGFYQGERFARSTIRELPWWKRLFKKF